MARRASFHRFGWSVVDGDLIDDLDRRAYRVKVLGRPRMPRMNASLIAEPRSSSSRPLPAEGVTPVAAGSRPSGLIGDR